MPGRAVGLSSKTVRAKTNSFNGWPLRTIRLAPILIFVCGATVTSRWRRAWAYCTKYDGSNP